MVVLGDRILSAIELHVFYSLCCPFHLDKAYNAFRLTPMLIGFFSILLIINCELLDTSHIMHLSCPFMLLFRQSVLNYLSIFFTFNFYPKFFYICCLVLNFLKLLCGTLVMWNVKICSIIKDSNNKKCGVLRLKTV